MRAIVPALAMMVLAVVLSGCAVAEVGGAVVSTTVGAASTAVDVTGDVVGGAAGTVTGSDDKKN